MTIRVLTLTEGRVAQLVSAGRSNRQVAEELGLTLKTVEWHLSRVYRKLGARSPAELSVLLLRSEARAGVATEAVEEVGTRAVGLNMRETPDDPGGAPPLASSPLSRPERSGAWR